MLDVNVTDEQRDYAWRLASQHNVARRGRNDGDKKWQYLGYLGEVVMADTLGLERPTVKWSFDNGIDFRIRRCSVDLKTSIRRSRINEKYGQCALMCDQYHGEMYLNDTYCFASYDATKRVMTFCGIIRKSAIAPDWFAPKGRTRNAGTQWEKPSLWDEYLIPVSAMHQFNSAYEFYWAFDRI